MITDSYLSIRDRFLCTAFQGILLVIKRTILLLTNSNFCSIFFVFDEFEEKNNHHEIMKPK